MVKLQTEIEIKPSAWKIGYEDKILMLGSCFSDEIGEQMQQRNMQVTCNPFGTLYNPLSIAQAIDYNSQCTIHNSQLIEYDGLWHSMAHHGSFSRPTKEEAEAAVAQSVAEMQKALREATVVIVTFGTAWVYEMVNAKSVCQSEGRSISETVCQQGGLSGKAGLVVANCHKMPESWFTRRRLTVDEIVSAWQPVIERYPDKHWIFTVSPIRHIRDGLHENQLSKATLLMAVNEMVNQSYKRSVQYFASYEILLDELRDYRFYADDLVHPSPLAVRYIWERFADTFCTPQTRNQMQIELKRWKQSQHRPLH